MCSKINTQNMVLRRTTLWVIIIIWATAGDILHTC